MWWKKQQRPHADRWLVLVTAGYAVLAILLLPLFRYHLQNDSFAYLSLAATHSSNPYWGPGFPWLIALLSDLGIPSLVAIRLLSILASVGLLVLVGSSRRFLPLSQDVWNTTILALGVFLLTKTLDIATPDILLTAILALMIRLLAEESPVAAAGGGLAAGLGYLTKSVALPFFLLSAILLLGYRWTTNPKKRKDAAASLGLSVLGCALLAGPWIATISLQHRGFTIGESAHVIHATMNPLQDNQIPMNVRGLLPPPTGVALSVWDDPTTLQYHDWSPVSSVGNIVMQIKIIVINASRMIDVVFREFWLAFGILAMSVVVALRRKNDALTGWCRLSTAVWAILLFLYLPIVTDDRYVWIGVVSLLLTGALLLEALVAREGWKGLQKNLALLLFFLAFTAYPAWRTVNAAGDGRAVAMDARAAAGVLTLDGARTAADNWKVGLAFSYYAKASYYGRPKNVSDPSALDGELTKDGIDVYVVTGAVPKLPSYREIITPARSVHLLRRVAGG